MIWRDPIDGKKDNTPAKLITAGCLIMLLSPCIVGIIAVLLGMMLG